MSFLDFSFELFYNFRVFFGPNWFFRMDLFSISYSSNLWFFLTDTAFHLPFRTATCFPEIPSKECDYP
jgi:hypothetical protein